MAAALSQLGCAAVGCIGRVFTLREALNHVVECHLRDEPLPGGGAICGDWAQSWECSSCHAKFYDEDAALQHKASKGEDHRHRKIDYRRYTEAQKQAGKALLDDCVHAFIRCCHATNYEPKLTDAMKAQFVPVAQRYPPEERRAIRGAPATRRGRSKAGSTGGTPERTPEPARRRTRTTTRSPAPRTPEPRPSRRTRTRSPAPSTPEPPRRRTTMRSPAPRTPEPPMTRARATRSRSRSTTPVSPQKRSVRSRSRNPECPYDPSMTAFERKPSLYCQTRSRETTPSNGDHDTRNSRRTMTQVDAAVLAAAIANNEASQKMAQKRAAGCSHEEPAAKKSAVAALPTMPPAPEQPVKRKRGRPPGSGKAKSKAPAQEEQELSPLPVPTRPGPIRCPSPGWFYRKKERARRSQQVKKEVAEVTVKEETAPVHSPPRRIAHEPHMSENGQGIEATAGPFVAMRKTPEKSSSPARTAPPRQAARPPSFPPPRQPTAPIRPTAPPPPPPAVDGHRGIPAPGVAPVSSPPAGTSCRQPPILPTGQPALPRSHPHFLDWSRRQRGEMQLSPNGRAYAVAPGGRQQQLGLPVAQPGQPLPVPPPPGRPRNPTIPPIPPFPPP